MSELLTEKIKEIDDKINNLKKLRHGILEVISGQCKH